MRISDWSSDVCSSDLTTQGDPAACIGLYNDSDGYQYEGIRCPVAHLMIGLITPDSRGQLYRRDEFHRLHHIFDLGDRKIDVLGRSVSVRVDLGVRRCIKKKTSQNSRYMLISNIN